MKQPIETITFHCLTEYNDWEKGGIITSKMSREYMTLSP